MNLEEEPPNRHPERARVRTTGMTRHRWLILCSIIVVASGACGGGDKKEQGAKAASGGAVSAEPAVQIQLFQFKPSSLTVKAGSTVTWTNTDEAIHSIRDTSPLATPVSPDLGKGATFSITYGEPGSYSYICGIHQYMTGSVTVVA
jgi:plastocyanin